MRERTKRPGETAFAVAMVVLSAVLLWQAWRIAGFTALSSPGAFPMAAAFAMLVSAVVVLLGTLRARPEIGMGWRDVAPPVVIALVAMIALYAVLLVPLGFLPTSLGFLTLAIWFLRRGAPLYALGVSALALIGVYVVFRLVFSVLMPAGIVPEGEILAWIGGLLPGGGTE